MVENLRVHDLVRIDIDACADALRFAPAWVVPALVRAPWVVVRRDRVAGGIAAGVRGATRALRFAITIEARHVLEIRAPESLRTIAHGSGPLECALETIDGISRELGMCVAPIGAYGFELASGIVATNSSSDLDLLVRVEGGIVASDLAAFARACRLAGEMHGVTIDVEVAVGELGFALAELVRMCETDAHAVITAKTPEGPRCVAIPVSMARSC